jgi:putative transposase
LRLDFIITTKFENLEERWEFFESKLNYIHYNPVKAGIVEKEEEYIWSSACDFYGNRKGKLELTEF